MQRWYNDTIDMVPFSDDPRVLMVRYEDLVTDSAAVIDRIFRFLGLEYDMSEILAFSSNPVSYDGLREDLKDLEGSEAAPDEVHEHLKLRNLQVRE